MVVFSFIFIFILASRTRSDGWPRFYGFSQSGYINAEIWGALIDKFCEIFNNSYPGMNALLFSDQMSSHLEPVVVADALSRNVHMWSLVANTSHWLQPLDDLPFANFKLRLTAEHSKAVFHSAIQGGSLADLLIPAAYEAESEAFTPAVITRAFENCGLFPFNETKIMDRFIQNTGLLARHGLEDGARAAASAIIQESIAEGQKEGRRKLVKGKAVVRKNAVFSPEGLLVAHAERERAEAAALKAKQEEAERRKCRGTDCTKVHRTGKSWLVCPCGSSRFCTAHLPDSPEPLELECGCHLEPPAKRRCGRDRSSAPMAPAPLRIPGNLLRAAMGSPCP